MSQSSKPSLAYSWFVVLTAALFFFYIFIQMNLFGSINADLIKEFDFSAQQLSYLFAFYSFGNILFLFPAGILLDRFSVRKLLLIVFIVSIIVTYIFSIVSNFWVMNVSRFILGMAGTFALLSVIKLASRWFAPRHMALVVGVAVTEAMLGGVIAQTPITLLTQSLGWRLAVQLTTYLGIILLIFQFIVVRDEPKGLEKVEVQEHLQLEKLGFWLSLGGVVKNTQNWLCGIYICLLNLPLFILGSMWGTSYLTQAHNFNALESSQIIQMIFWGMMVGSPLAGWVSDKIRLRKLPMIIGAILSLSVMSLIMFAPTLSFISEVFLYFLLGVVIGSQVIGYPVIAESNLHSITATATSFCSILIMSGGMLVPLFGWLLERSGNAQIVNGVKIYSVTDFLGANYMMLIGLLIALLTAFFIKETYCKQLHKR